MMWETLATYFYLSNQKILKAWPKIIWFIIRRKVTTEFCCNSWPQYQWRLSDIDDMYNEVTKDEDEDDQNHTKIG